MYYWIKYIYDHDTPLYVYDVLKGSFNVLSFSFYQCNLMIYFGIEVHIFMLMEDLLCNPILFYKYFYYTLNNIINK